MKTVMRADGRQSERIGAIEHIERGWKGEMWRGGRNGVEEGRGRKRIEERGREKWEEE